MNWASVLDRFDADDAIGAVLGGTLCQRQLVFAYLRCNRIHRIVDLALVRDPEQRWRLSGTDGMALAEISIDTDSVAWPAHAAELRRR
mgnify:FL=1